MSKCGKASDVQEIQKNSRLRKCNYSRQLVSAVSNIYIILNENSECEFNKKLKYVCIGSIWWEQEGLSISCIFIYLQSVRNDAKTPVL